MRIESSGSFKQTFCRLKLLEQMGGVRSFLYKSPGVSLGFKCAQQHIAHIGLNDPAQLGDDILTDRPQNARKREEPKNKKKES